MSVCAHIQDYIPKEPRSSRNLWYKFLNRWKTLFFFPHAAWAFYFHLGAIMILTRSQEYMGCTSWRTPVLVQPSSCHDANYSGGQF